MLDVLLLDDLLVVLVLLNLLLLWILGLALGEDALDLVEDGLLLLRRSAILLNPSDGENLQRAPRSARQCMQPAGNPEVHTDLEIETLRIQENLISSRRREGGGAQGHSRAHVDLPLLQRADESLEVHGARAVVARER